MTLGNQRPVLAAGFACAVTVDNTALGQVVRRHFEIDAITRKNLDAMATQPSGDMRQDRMAVFKLDGEGRARENLFDRTKQLEGRLLHRLIGDPGSASGLGIGVPTSPSYDRTAF